MQGILKSILIGLLAIIICLQFLLLPEEWRLLDVGVRNCTVISLLTVVTLILAWKKLLIIPKSIITGLVFSILVLHLLSGLWAVHVSLIWPNVIGWTCFLAIYFTTHSLPNELVKSEILRSLLLFVISANIGQILFSYSDVLIDNNWHLTLSLIESVPRKYTLNTNFLGSMFLLYIPILSQLKANKFQKWLKYSNLFFILFLLPLFNSRAVTLALLVLLAFYLWRSYKNGLALRYLLAIVIVGALTLLTYQSFVVNKSNFVKTYNPMRTIVEDTGDDRIEIWKNSIQLFKEKPLLGNGSGNWKTEVYKFGYNDYKNGLRVGHAHNFWIEVIAEIGIVGLIILIALGICISLFAIKERQWHFLIALIGFCVLSSFYGIYQVNENSMSPYLMLLFAWLGIITRDIKSISGSRIYLFPYMLFLAFIVYLSYSQAVLHRYIDKLSHLNVPALKLELKDWDKYNHRFVSQFKNGKHLLFVKSNHEWNIGKRHLALQTLDESLKVNPYDKRAWQIYGNRSLSVKGFQNATLCYENAIGLYSRNNKASLNLCRLGLRFNDARVFQLGMNGYYDFTLPIYKSHYRDEFLIGEDLKIANYWLNECQALDQYQFCLDAWQAKQQKLNK